MLCVSTSGDSENVVKAANLALKKEMQVISLTGENGAKLEDISALTIKILSSRGMKANKIIVLKYACQNLPTLLRLTSHFKFNFPSVNNIGVMKKRLI